MRNVKKLVGLVLAVLMLTTLGVVPTVQAGEVETVAGANLIANGGFETVSQYEETEFAWADGWEPNGSTYNTTVVGTDASITSEKVYEGKKSLKVVTDGEGRYIHTKVENLTPGTAYRASVWVYIAESAGFDFDKYQGVDIRVCSAITAGVQDYIATSAGASNRVIVDSGNGWRQLNATFVPTATETYDGTFAYIALRIHTGTPAGSIIYYDNVELYEITGINGSFDTAHNETLKPIEGEDRSFLWADGWSATNTYDGKLEGSVTFIGEGAELSDTVYRSAPYAMKLSNTINADGTKTSRVYMPVTGLTEGKLYKISAWTKGDAKGTLYAIESHSGLTNTTNGAQILSLKTASSASDWTEVITYFYAPADNAYIVLGTPAITSEQSVYFDDVTITDASAEFYNSQGVKLSKAEAGDITVKASYPSSADTESAVLIVVVYNTVGNIKQLEKIEIIDGANKSFKNNVREVIWGEASLTIESVGANQSVKAMIWDGMGGLSQLADFTELPVGA